MRLRNLHVWLGLCAILLATLSFGRLVGTNGPGGGEPIVVTPHRGSLDVRIVEIGTLVAPRSVTIASEIGSNRAKVVRLAPEGSVVGEGDLLAEFDPAPFLEDVTKYSRAVREAEANLLQVRQDESLEEAKNEQLRQDAEMRVRMAEIDLRSLEGGGAPLTAKEARARVEQAEQQLLHASRGAADAEAFLEKGFITRKEFEEALSRRADASRAHELATAQFENLVKFRQPADLERARAQLDRARSELERLAKVAGHQSARQRASRTKAEMVLEAAEADLRKAREELEKTTIRAPTSGFLVYNELPVGSEYRKVQIGDSVWQGQAILTIPDTSEMAVETAVREFDIHKVRAGQRARIRLDAFRDQTLPGRVEFIGNLAARRGPSGGEKSFALRVRLDESRPDLRPGMTAEVEIEVETITDALLLPVEAVFEKDGRHYCELARRGETVERRVELGTSDSDFVEIVAGLEGNEAVHLNPSGPRQLPRSRR